MPHVLLSDAIAALLDPSRLAVAGAVVGRPADVDAIVERSGIGRSNVLAALGRLREVGLVDAVDGAFVLPPERLRHLVAEVNDPDLPMDPVIGFGMSDDERAVLERFFQGRSLTEIPANRAKRLIVLQRLAQEFDLGRRYDEAEVNAVLRPFHLDVAALRRHLVDEDFLDRSAGTYLRSGGRTD